MKTPRSDRNSIRSEKLIVKMSLSEKEKLQKSADDMGLTMSSYVRWLIKKDVERGENDD